MTKASILQQYNRTKYSKLAASVMLDVIGMSSYLLPVIGEAEDLVWAPISGLICFLLYRGKLGVFGGLGSTAEEMLPFTDIIPSVTGIWAVQYRLREKQTLQEHLRRLNLKEEIIEAFVNDGTLTVDAVEDEHVSMPRLRRFQKPTAKPVLSSPPEDIPVPEETPPQSPPTAVAPPPEAVTHRTPASPTLETPETPVPRAPEPLDADEAELMKKYGM